MTKHFLRDLDRLRRAVLLNGSAVEAAVEKAITALMDGQVQLAKEVIEGDAKVDERELDIETDCLKILALHQPVAQDLRFLIAVLKVNNDLERIGDLAVNLAERAEILSCRDESAIPAGFHDMSQCTRAMVRGALDVLMEPNLEGAQQVLDADDEVDTWKSELTKELIEMMRADPSQIDCAVPLILAARDLERIADMATNIAEDVVFMLEGELIRHAYRRQAP